MSYILFHRSLRLDFLSRDLERLRSRSRLFERERLRLREDFLSFSSFTFGSSFTPTAPPLLLAAPSVLTFDEDDRWRREDDVRLCDLDLECDRDRDEEGERERRREELECFEREEV